MNILVVGCGKVGSKLANMLFEQGHDVAVVDDNEENFELLDSKFDGFTLNGVPIDQDVLIRAGIESCEAVAAVTPDDNVNIMVSQLAEKIFKIPVVIARIYDPKREDVFSHFGLSTVCPTNLTVESIYAALTNKNITQNMHFSTSTVSFSTVNVPKKMIGKDASSIICDDNESLFGVLHNDGRLILLNPDCKIILTAEDKLVFARVVD